jgi:L-threonylcarbamoyladenylate synthase
VAADDDGLAEAAAALRAGHLVVIPTDTVYGVAVDPTTPGAADRLFSAKGRSRGVPLAVLVASPEAGLALASPPPGRSDVAARLAHAHWPGPLTLVVTRGPGWAADLGDTGETIGVRCPDHGWVRELCRLVGPVATSSANRHGEAPAATAVQAAAMLGSDVALIIDGGSCGGEPSTVVDVSNEPPRVLRQGRLSAAALDLDLDRRS